MCNAAVDRVSPASCAEPDARAERGATVAVVVNCFNDAQFLADALASLASQSRAPDEVLIVDDGSDSFPAELLATCPAVRYVRQDNAGLAAARNLGLATVDSEFVVFLDADDRLTHAALAAGLACFAAAGPAAAMVYGGHRRVDRAWRPLGPDAFIPIGSDPFGDLLHGNLIAMHATAMYRVAMLRAVGGFDASLRVCEDYDLYLKLARDHAVVSHPAIVAEYRWHGGNMSRNAAIMLEQALAVHARYDEPGASPSRRTAWHAGRQNWLDYYRSVVAGTGAMSQPDPAPTSFMRRAARALRRRLLSRLRRPPKVGRVRYGDLGTTRPISMDFGFDRGLPTDRFYIERFLARHSADICGHVLEIGDDAYSRRFGNAAVSKQDILHVEPGNRLATIVGDLCMPGVLPDAQFDCIVLTQTLHLLFDLQQAVTRLHAALRPGGVLLLTAPGITQLERGRWGQTWYWSFTKPSLDRLFAPVFGSEQVEIEAHGNVFAATAMLQGLAVEEVGRARLEVVDPAYPVILTLRALKR